MGVLNVSAQTKVLAFKNTNDTSKNKKTIIKPSQVLQFSAENKKNNFSVIKNSANDKGLLLSKTSQNKSIFTETNKSFGNSQKSFAKSKSGLFKSDGLKGIKTISPDNSKKFLKNL